ncbi:MAG: hypothetical protein JNK37_06405 [Verrucomicrobiales bacterium]|nr:hypothetical protein [Verrucomicrobiales bacterium]
MDEPRSVIGNGLGLSVFALLTGLSALCFLADHLSNRGEAATGPVQVVAPTAPGESAPAEWKAQLAAIEADRDTLRGELESLRRDQGAIGTEASQLRESIDRLKQDLAAAQTERDRLREQTTKDRLTVEGFEAEKARLTQELSLARAASGGEVERLRGELQAARRMAQEEAKSWATDRDGLESKAENLEQQNELLKLRLAEGLKSALPKAGQNAAAAMNPDMATIAKLRAQIVELERQLEELNRKRDEVAPLNSSDRGAIESAASRGAAVGQAKR